MSSQFKVTSGQRQRMIEEAAYYKAERRGFNGDPVRDWCEAEAEIDARLLQLEDGLLVERVEQSLALAAKRVAAVRRKIARVSSDARAEWERDLERLALLRDSLKPKLAELREQGEQAGRKLREQAERIGAEISDLVQRLETKAKH
jgi:hypothetical protein